jgi:hypothetical protein
MGLIYRFLFQDFFVPVWPNIAASGLLAIHVTKSNRKHGFYLGRKEGRG